MLVSTNDASSVLVPNLPQRGPQPVLLPGPFLPLILLLLLSPLLYRRPRQRLPPPVVFVVPRRQPTGLSLWSSTPVGFGTWRKPRSPAAEHSDSVGTVARKVTIYIPAQ